ncbi:NAD(P)-dependent alcohol dehydrogenase [Saccharolobus caldissimus]|uniref:NAD(P)-dependent alcohol dehydrogenase n=1 Tax=Saccharolobus caldissimus TaxID=1702097 RepID=A0AAQ4CS62_9CREN|nr:NAD(P)-dependent alcohol dehydrogenase [Saccharolobus caldissimus]BDB98643.1 NAD(P)-dependent alcohol dehydrogenase [Saccharolobus caldissimus]
MRAMQILEFGKPLVLRDIDIPKVNYNQVLVKVEANGVCHTDLSVRDGTIYKRVNVKPKLPLTPGHEIAGVVAEVGDNVPLSKGDKVLVNPWIGEGSCYYCRIGEEQYCDNPTWLGINTDGGFAEYVVVPDFKYLYKISNLSPIEAAPLACSGVTVYRALRLANLDPSKSVLIIGVGGGLGSMAVQIAKNVYGSLVIGVDINEEGLKLAERLGADYVFRVNEISEIMRVTENRGVDAIIDLVGSNIEKYYPLLAKLGKYVKVGTFGGTLPQEAGLRLHSMGWQFLGTLTGNQRDFLSVVKLGENGKIKPVVTTLKLEDANKALENLEKNKITGRQVLIP